MKKFYIIFLCLILAISLTSCVEKDSLILYTDKAEPHDFVYSDGPSAYGYYNIGNCKKLVGKVYTLVIFLEDNESRWDEKDINQFYNNKFFPSFNYLKEQSELRKVPLDLDCGQYATCADGMTRIRYDGIIEADSSNASMNLDIMKQTAKSLGFMTPEIMHAFLKNSTKAEQIAYILAVNKRGQAYAVADSYDDGADSIEFVVAFSSSSSSITNVGSTVVHEMLHLFGASDLYDPEGEYPQRKKLAKKLYPKDIMMLSAINPYGLEFGQLTSFLIGWTDSFPSECDCEEWWYKVENENSLPDREPYKPN